MPNVIKTIQIMSIFNIFEILKINNENKDLIINYLYDKLNFAPQQYTYALISQETLSSCLEEIETNEIDVVDKILELTQGLYISLESFEE